MRFMEPGGINDKGKIEEEVARILLGEYLDHIEEERNAFRKAMERDIASFLAR